MRTEHDIWFELYAENVVVAVFGIGETVAETGARLLDGLRDAAATLARPVDGDARPVRAAAALGPDRDDAARRLPRPAGGRPLRRAPRAGSPPSRSPPTRPACPTCCPASG